MLRVKYLLINLLALLCLSCSPQPRGEDEIYIGTITGPETDLMKVAKTVAEDQYDLKVTIIPFEDYVMPNTALAEGEIDANMFQHQPYLDDVIAKKHYLLTPIGKMFLYPMGVYSSKYKKLEDLPRNAIIGIPNDPSNAARALLLLEKAELIKLSSHNMMNLSPKDIETNRRQLVFKEIAAPQLPRTLTDLDAAVINTNYAIAAGMLPHRDALFFEKDDSPYVNVIVVRTKEKNLPKYDKLVDALHSPEVVQAAKDIFSDQAVKGW